ncbi:MULTISPECIES: MerR family transcriptional regulator [unclassified Pseudodesulfovibrio]|uniref:MerR family transcriptional regulator n=1 Tax=unclassified Pseudodesulfovibrio TaxID=2661612 RepID=UPI000FEB84CE|nr:MULTISPECIES: MerR family transcriptional regulator [unclassified Pseudodesulfovibrio]MCJ2165132.1 MerR family transcriptional regulator [Pseudodesulfovibrio sp. S3-i]RWU03411.1 MerR family transcriptional regulator [Pseudodesulfovibrio sp. S3]
MADTYTHKDLATLCGVSETTIKSYRRKFPGFIPVLTRGKPIRFSHEAGEVCLRIRDCFAKGMSVNETFKVLKENFKEQPTAKPRRATAPETGASGTISEEYLQKFFATAGQMMQGMAGLATAQVKAEQRLRKVESVLGQLLELEARNEETFGKLLEQRYAAPDPTFGSSPVSEPVSEPTPEPVSEPAPRPEPEARIRARKIVNVRGPEGAVESYALEKDQEQSARMEQPSDAFLNTPIVIHNDQGEFLGVPGRLPLSGFVNALVREAEETGASVTAWTRKDDAWVFTMDAPGGDTHALHFSSTTTPRGNLVVLLGRLDVNGTQTTPQFLQEFFRQVKDKI